MASERILSRKTKAPLIKIPLKKKRNFDAGAFLAHAGLRQDDGPSEAPKSGRFPQGDLAESIFYIQSGRIRLSVLATTGKEATVALLGVKVIFAGKSALL